MRISRAFRSIQRLCIEAAPFIYYVENHPTYGDKMRSIFQHVELEKTLIVASVITLTETLVKPIQAGDHGVENIYRELLLTNERIQLIPVSAAIADSAAHLRARYNLRTPDALHLATALETNCDAFLTNDRTLKRMSDIRILVLDELEISPPDAPGSSQ